jgi:hypothetical protein
MYTSKLKRSEKTSRRDEDDGVSSSNFSQSSALKEGGEKGHNAYHHRSKNKALVISSE